MSDEPLLSEERRKVLEDWLRSATDVPEGIHGDISCALDEIARLRSQVDALATELAVVCHDKLEDGARALVERAVSEEREAILAIVVDYYGDGHDAASSITTDAFLKKYGTNDLYEAIAARGPLKPPLPPHEAAVQNERLREALARIVGAYDGSERGGMVCITDAIEAARELLGRET